MAYLTPPMRDLLAWCGALQWTVPDVYSPAECAELVARIDAAEPVLAPVTTARGPVVRTDIRTNERVMFDDADLAAELFRRVHAHVPWALAGRVVLGANPRFRGYRYREGQAFKPHYDGSYRASEALESELTLLLYLNDGFAGGGRATRPRTGAPLRAPRAPRGGGGDRRHKIRPPERRDVRHVRPRDLNVRTERRSLIPLTLDKRRAPVRVPDRTRVSRRPRKPGSGEVKKTANFADNRKETRSRRLGLDPEK